MCEEKASSITLSKLLPESYAKQAIEAENSRENKINWLIVQKKLPDKGWDDLTIEMFLNKMSSMDSNNFLSNIGVGEREGRFVSELVAKRHYRFCHGIGRSGDLLEPQPKAAGSTLVNKLTNILLVDLMRSLGIRSPIECMLVPVATGMSIVLSLLTLRQLKPKAKYVIWPRIDQKSCFKSIISAGFEPIIIENLKVDDSLTTNLAGINGKIEELGVENIACIFSTTSCFAPRVCDDLEGIAKIAKHYKIFHLVNNAYGLQSFRIMERIQKAKKLGRVDLFIQSTDKNFMVPVGGAIVAGFNTEFLKEMSKTYPGRASFTPTLDTLITLLSLGKERYLELLKNREYMYTYLYDKLNAFAESVEERVLVTPNNDISIGITLSNLLGDNVTKLGSMLFTRGVTGARVVTAKEIKKIKEYEFVGWSSHCNDYGTPYLTAAAAIGVKKEEIDLFLIKLNECYNKLKEK